jgi:hypothetical protein
MRAVGLAGDASRSTARIACVAALAIGKGRSCTVRVVPGEGRCRIYGGLSAGPARSKVALAPPRASDFGARFFVHAVGCLKKIKGNQEKIKGSWQGMRLSPRGCSGPPIFALTCGAEARSP